MSAGTNPVQGLGNMTMRPTSKFWIRENYACTVDVGGVTTNPIKFLGWSDQNPPTRNNAQPGAQPWQNKGGDFAPWGTVQLAANVPGFVTGQAVGSALHAMMDGGASVQNFLVRKTNTDYNNVGVSGSIDVDFDLAD